MEPTSKQHAFARKLEAQLTADQQAEIRGDIFGRAPVWGSNPVRWAPTYNAQDVTRERFSQYIDALITATGGESRPFVPRSRAQRYGGRRRSRGLVGGRCTHEDYPCCGCERG